MARNPRRSDPTGSYRQRVEEADTYENIGQFAWESLPGVGTYYTVDDIKNELRQEKPNYLKIGALAGAEVIGLVPGLGGAAKNMIRKGATFRKKSDVVDVESNIPSVPKNKPEELSGTLPTRHGFTGDRPTEFLPRGEYKGQRYDSDGGVFGDKPLYLEDPENPFFLTDDGVVAFSYDGVTDVDASFDKAFVLTPETLGTLKSKVGDVDLLDEASGPLVVDKLEELGYDGLIIRGFPNSDTTELGRLRAEQSDKLRSLSKEDFEKGYGIVEDYKPRIQAAREAEGIDETLQQSQVLAFRPERQKVLDPAGNPQLDNEAYAAKMNSFDVEDDMETWKKNVKAEIAKSRDVDPVVRTYPLEDAAQRFLDKEITREQYLKYIDEYKPVTGWDQLPREPSTKAMVYSLKPNQIERGSFVLSPEDAAKLDVKQSSLSVGDFFDGRLDVTAYKEFDTWIVAGAKTGEKGQHYAKAVHYEGGDGKPVILLNSDNPKKYETNIKTGERIGAAQQNPRGETYGKTPYAAISGYVKDLDVDNIRSVAAQLLDDPEWVQLGFDPRRQGNFYVRREKSNAPIHAVATSAEEVIQIGPLVLAKNPVLDLDYEGYNKGGMAMDEQMKAVFKSSRGMAAGGSVDLDTVPDNTIGVDPVSGNEVPLGSSPEEVRDDIPAQLSEGEYVVPADVVRYYGVKYFEDLRAQAKFGYQDMQENGRIGGEPVGMEMGGDELPFDISELQVVDEPVQMNEGGMPVAYGGTMYGGSGVEYIEYTNGTRTMLIPFFNGVPMAIIPEGFYPGSPKTAAEKPAEVQSSDDDDDRPDTERSKMPEPIDYANLTTDELAEMVEQQTTLGMDDGIQALLTGLNPIAGLFMKGAMVHQAKLTKKELERRVESEDISDEERARIQSLIEVTEQPSFMQGILGKIKGAFDKEETKEPEIPTIDKQSVTDAVTEAMMYDPTAKSVLEESTITTSELTPIVTPTNKAGEMPEPYRPVIEGPNVTAMRKKYLGDENKQPDVDFADPTMVPEDPNANETENMRMRRAGERAGDYVTSKTKARMIRREAEKRGKSIAEIGRAIAPTKDDGDPTDTGGKGNVGLGSGAGGMKKGGLASKKKKKNNQRL